MKLEEALRRFLSDLQVKNYSPTTIRERKSRVNVFIVWAGERGVHDAESVSREMIRAYQRKLSRQKKSDGNVLSVESQINYISNISYLFRWLVKNNLIKANPASDLELPRAPRRLPKAILSHAEIENVLNCADVNTEAGIRDRAFMEMLYATGIRRMEICTLQKQDVQFDQMHIFVRQGKGQRDRVVPIGERAIYWAERYLNDVRRFWHCEDDTFFVTPKGKPMRISRYSELVRRYLDLAGIKKSGGCHLFRHSAATLMLEGGADIRYIQQFLGHARLNTTQIYTQVSIKKLKAVHAATHPAALRARTSDDD